MSLFTEGFTSLNLNKMPSARFDGILCKQRNSITYKGHFYVKSVVKTLLDEAHPFKQTFFWIAMNVEHFY